MNGPRFRAFARQFLGYFGVAAIGLVVDFGSLVLLTEVFHVHYLLSAVIGFVLGLAVTYILSEVLVFRDPKIRNGWVRFGLFAAIGLIGLALMTLLMWVCVDVLGLDYIVAKVAVTAVVYLWNFFARRAMYRS